VLCFSLVVARRAITDVMKRKEGPPVGHLILVGSYMILKNGCDLDNVVPLNVVM
jgi:hypothetical protein